MDSAIAAFKFENDVNQYGYLTDWQGAWNTIRLRMM